MPAAILSDPAAQSWLRQAESQQPAKIGMPLASLLGEALDLAAHFDAHWQGDSAAAPGVWFHQIASDQVHEGLGSELRELAQLVAKVQAARSLRQSPAAANAPTAPNAGEHAHRLLREMRATLSFVFDDESTRGRAQLERLNREFSAAHSHDELALALETYSHLLEEHRNEVEQGSNFDFAVCEQALATAVTLRGRSAERLTDANSSAKETTKLRNQLLTLLLLRMQNVRRAARYLFRDDPERIKLFESVHERVRRRVRKR